MKIYETVLYDREDMPQVDDIPRAIKDMKEKGIEIKKEKFKPSDMKPSQKTLTVDKVDSIAKDFDPKKMKDIILSLDDHIVDGHHRWAGAIKAGYGNDKVSIYRIMLNRRMAIAAYNEVAK